MIEEGSKDYQPPCQHLLTATATKGYIVVPCRD
jgi:hypothetical protein